VGLQLLEIVMEDVVPVLLVIKLLLYLFHGVYLSSDGIQLIFCRCVKSLYPWVSTVLTEPVIYSGNVDNTVLSIATRL
jgi:hypothetical protein